MSQLTSHGRLGGRSEGRLDRPVQDIHGALDLWLAGLLLAVPS
jgi:hypothetical protein